MERNPTCEARVDDIFDRIDAGPLQAITSPITLAECLVGAIKHGLPHVQQDFTDVIVSGANVTFMTPDAAAAQQAADLRVRYNLGLLDALQVAVAIGSGADGFLTNDRALLRVRELPILVVDDLEL